ncbi:MAG: hypothetical protein Q9227_008314 [Pyrenula ochraceoflavens]
MEQPSPQTFTPSSGTSDCTDQAGQSIHGSISDVQASAQIGSDKNNFNPSLIIPNNILNNVTQAPRKKTKGLSLLDLPNELLYMIFSSITKARGYRAVRDEYSCICLGLACKMLGRIAIHLNVRNPFPRDDRCFQRHFTRLLANGWNRNPALLPCRVSGRLAPHAFILPHDEIPDTGFVNLILSEMLDMIPGQPVCLPCYKTQMRARKIARKELLRMKQEMKRSGVRSCDTQTLLGNEIEEVWGEAVSIVEEAEEGKGNIVYL